MLREDVERLCGIASANDIPLDAGFNWDIICRHGFFSEPRKLAESVTARMLTICRNGIVNGFDNDMKADLKELSSIVAELSTVDAIDSDRKKFERLQKRSDKVMAEQVKEPVIDNAISANLKKYVNSSIAAIDTLVSLNEQGNEYCKIGAEQIKLFGQSKEKLNALLEEYKKVYNLTSKQAVAYYKRVLSLLAKWRDVFANRMCTSATVKYIDDAIDVIKEWQNEVVSVSKRDKAKKEDLAECEVYVRDEVDLLGGCLDKLEELQAFKNRMDEDGASISQKQSELNKIATEKAVCEEKLAGISSERKKAVAEYKNTGDMRKLNIAAKQLDEKEAMLNDKIESLYARIVEDSADLTQRKDIHDKLKEVYDSVMKYQNDPVMLCLILGGIGEERGVDFNALASMFRGIYDDRTVQAALMGITRISASISTLRDNRKNIITNLSKYDEVNKEYVKKQIDNILGNKKTIVKPAIVSDKVLSESALNMLKEFDVEDEEEKKVTKKVETIIPISDTDK